MGKFLAIYNGAADDAAKDELSEEQQSDFMRAWGAWAQANADALIDPGAPLFMKRVVTSQGVEDFTDAMVGTPSSWRTPTTRRSGSSPSILTCG